jgi:2-polyprenyl-3-methyl-5-hydroxy-6-metoxy-1,4-benzoquinol methylase
VNVAGSISTETLVRLWRSKYGIDAARFFSAAQMQLAAIPPCNYYRFTAAHPGDAAFYAELMGRIGYDRQDKPEFTEAAREIAATDRVLDVGCGAGAFSLACAGVYRGIDTNPAAIEEARRMGRNVHLASIHDESSDTYNVVTLFQVLEHVEEPREFLKSCVRCLRADGRLIVSTPDIDGFMGSLTNEILNYPPHHMTWWSTDSLRALVEDCGCEVTKIWHEPLRRDHLRAAFSAILWPRDEAHLTESLRFRVVELWAKLLARAAARKWIQVPFVRGHSVMMVARKVR